MCLGHWTMSKPWMIWGRVNAGGFVTIGLGERIGGSSNLLVVAISGIGDSSREVCRTSQLVVEDW